MGKFLFKILDAFKLNDDDDEDEDDYDLDDTPVQKETKVRPTRSSNTDSVSDQTKERTPVRRSDVRQQPPMRRTAVEARETQAESRVTSRASYAENTESRVSSRVSTTDSERTESRQRTVPMRSQVVSDSEIKIVSPKRFEDSQQICDMLKNGRAIILNLNEIEPTEGQRVMDFISGAIYSLDAKIHQISGFIFCISPANVEVSGDYISSLSSSGFRINEVAKSTSRPQTNYIGPQNY